MSNEFTRWSTSLQEFESSAGSGGRFNDGLIAFLRLNERRSERISNEFGTFSPHTFSFDCLLSIARNRESLSRNQFGETNHEQLLRTQQLHDEMRSTSGKVYGMLYVI